MLISAWNYLASATGAGLPWSGLLLVPGPPIVGALAPQGRDAQHAHVVSLDCSSDGSSGLPKVSLSKKVAHSCRGVMWQSQLPPGDGEVGCQVLPSRCVCVHQHHRAVPSRQRCSIHLHTQMARSRRSGKARHASSKLLCRGRHRQVPLAAPHCQPERTRTHAQRLTAWLTLFAPCCQIRSPATPSSS